MESSNDILEYIKLTYKGCGAIVFEHNGHSFAINPNIKTSLPINSDLVKALKDSGLLVE